MQRTDYFALTTAQLRVRHRWLTIRMLGETIGIFIALALAANWLGPHWGEAWWGNAAYVLILLAQAFTLLRIYFIAHEAAHKKIAPHNVRANDFIGQAVLLPMLVPLQVYRAIHNFHHGFNRRDVNTSALDVFVVPWRVTPLIRAVCYGLWFLGVFAGGFFFHSLVSIVIFLFLPTRTAQKISPAFKHWTPRDRAIAWGQFLAGVALYGTVYASFGANALLFTLVYPLLAFAWGWSLLVYVFHYRTTLGAQTRYNVRAIRRQWFFSWLILNFNDHATHHMYPHIPWYELPNRRAELPAAYAEKNPTETSVPRAILNQLRGPLVVSAGDNNPVPWLFVHWED
jgi:fatty acid desaturase